MSRATRNSVPLLTARPARNGHVGHPARHVAEAELARRALARRGLVAFGAYAYRGFVAKSFHVAIAEALEKVETGEITRLIISMPPRHGKSTLTSEIFPAWFLGRNPDKRIIACSYAASLAHKLSRKARNLIASQAYTNVFGARGEPSLLTVRRTRGGDRRYSVELAKDSRSVGSWDLAPPYRGGYTSAGVGGSITGMGAHILLIDDPVKGGKESASATISDGVWEWYLSDAYTRLEENGAVIVIMTRWAEDDLAGRLLQAARDDPETDQWVELRLPAMAEASDPLGRAEGEPLWPEKFPVERLRKIASVILARPFAALFQQSPIPATGSMFPAGCFPIVDAAPAGLPRVRYWDKAGTEGGEGAYTAAVLMSRGHDGTYYIEDVARDRWGSDRRNAVMRQTAETDGVPTHVWVEQEPGSGGKESAEISVKLLAGFLVQIERVTGDKATRATPLSYQAHAGNVKLVRGAWNKAFIDEATLFPVGRYKDQIDAAGGAFNKLALAVTGRQPVPTAFAPRAIVDAARDQYRRFGVR